MRRQLLCMFLSCSAIGLSACTTFRLVHRPARLDSAKACADWRWIGISRPEVQCPEIPGWTVRPLFPQLAPAQRKSDDYCDRCDRKDGEVREDGENDAKCDYCDEQKSENVPDIKLIRELNRFCVYEPQKLLKKPRLPPGANADLVRVDQDCAALSFADTELKPKDLKEEPDSKVWPSNYKDFLSEAGQQGASLQVDATPSVRLAFLDTQPTEEGFPSKSARSPHGYTLANIARNLVCSSDRCAAHITTQLALPVIEFSPKGPKHKKVDPDRGGYLGMQSDLAVAIREEVDSWLKAKSQRHLVLNLSLAWDGRLFGGLGEEWITEMRAGTQAVYRALQYASGFDVLVLAAAGNQKCAPCVNDGPLLPAAWEERTPQEQGCPIETRDKPLLYAVGGVDSDGSPLANARSGGMPRRAAYGETVVTERSGYPSKPISSVMIYSGSSVATAVVSSIAAVVWNSDPDLNSHQVMKILDKSGHPLKFEADFWFRDPVEPTVPTVHRLSLCSAPGQPGCSWEPKERLQRDNITWSRGSCEPWSYPQPEDPPCMACIKPPP